MQIANVLLIERLKNPLEHRVSVHVERETLALHFLEALVDGEKVERIISRSLV